MSKLVKTVILIITLGLPVCIYLFLQGFGENRYALPVYPEAALTSEECGQVAPGYSIDRLACDGSDVVVLGDALDYVFHFPDPHSGDIAREMNEVRRLVEETKEIDYRLVTFSAEAQVDRWEKLAAAEVDIRYWVVTSACEDNLEQLKNCQLLLSLAEIDKNGSLSRMVLVDKLGRVRGLYASSGRDEIDRLLVELDVLMQEK